MFRSPKVPKHEILGAQHLSFYEKGETGFSSCPKAEVSRLWHPGASRGQPWWSIYLALMFLLCRIDEIHQQLEEQLAVLSRFIDGVANLRPKGASLSLVFFYLFYSFMIYFILVTCLRWQAEKKLWRSVTAKMSSVQNKQYETRTNIIHRAQIKQSSFTYCKNSKNPIESRKNKSNHMQINALCRNINRTAKK